VSPRLVTIVQTPLVVGKKKGRKNYVFRLDLNMTELLRKVLDHLPLEQEVDDINLPDASLFDVLNCMSRLRVIPMHCRDQIPLVVHLKHAELIRRLAADPQLDNWDDLYREVGRHFNDNDEKLTVTSLIWVHLSSNREGMGRVQKLLAYEANGLSLNAKLVSAMRACCPSS
jgi:hypothetical protein